MASPSKSPKQPKISETTQDMISSMPTEVTDKIMKCLPLKMAAKMSMLSRKWRRNWLSHRYLVFDTDFWDGQCKNGEFDWHNINNIISNILFYHNGPVQVFHFHFPVKLFEAREIFNHSPWLSFLSRVGVKKIYICNWSGLTVRSHIYAYKELVKLKIEYNELVPPPCEFKGFAHLRNLELVGVKIKHDSLKNLIANCPRLTVLVLMSCSGMSNMVINAPSLENFTIQGVFESLAFENVPCIKSIRVCLNLIYKDPSDVVTVNGIKTLACSSLQCLHFGGQMCKFLAAGYIAQPFTLTFNHLHRLCLTELDLSDFGVFCFTFSMLQSCPFMEDLRIALSPNKSIVEHKYDYTEDYKLGQLLKVVIIGITGSSAEFKLIEYVLATSVVLEKLLFKCANLDPSSELKVSRELLQLPRASPMAKLVCWEQ